MNTYNEIVAYLKLLKEAVDVGLSKAPQAKSRQHLLRLKMLLGMDSVNRFYNDFVRKRFNISACREIEEMDNIIGELRVMQFNLPEMEAREIVSNVRSENEKRTTLLSLMLGLFGFEWVTD